MYLKKLTLSTIMKSILFLIPTFLTLHVFAQQAPPGLNIDSMMIALETHAIGKQLDSFTVFYRGKKFTNKNLAHKTVFINFWNTTCLPCMAELTELNHLYDTLKRYANFEYIFFHGRPSKRSGAHQEKICNSL